MRSGRHCSRTHCRWAIVGAEVGATFVRRPVSEPQPRTRIRRLPVSCQRRRRAWGVLS